ncbi:ABC transporter ATP-binding protein [Alkalimarinus alittae]|uniref:ABC transporter ATP-binding protein n=1 Tax=Alkalimarinus alittae TaxID=2961619 RepID=A0ABY6N3C6_9ALTE|nr:ABC transporter ATP-binding protein [Alkalimarinus alittae]UZE96626.1 ABC transporter ATP-binding protein [Alkalimarinus alittae]
MPADDHLTPLSFDLECRNLSKAFGDFVAVDDVSFKIPQGSFFSILGPSGCGKTTLLRMLAGFQQPSSGDIFIKNKSVLNTPPNKRPVNMVFQHLALFPTMTVAENIAYGLKRRGISKSEQQPLIKDVLERIDLPDAGNKRIDQLSGGQKQRIAIARCLVLKPDVLLLDEPLGALDLKLREQMKIELKHLQQVFGTTFIYITHDQSEALVMSDQVAVMNNGRFEQVGTPQELYYQPETPFVASFVGDSNRWYGKVSSQDEDLISLTTEQGLKLNGLSAPGQQLNKHDAVTAYIRPEAISIVPDATTAPTINNPEDINQCQGRIVNVLFDGARSQVLVDTSSGEPMHVSLPQTGQHSHLSKGDNVTLQWSKKQCLCFRAPQHPPQN